MKKDSSINVLTQPGLNIGYLSFNATKPPFDKKEVRQAISMAIDKAAIIKDVYLGAGQPAKNLIPPTMLGYNDKVVDYSFDPAKAKAMMTAAGVSAPIDIDLWYMPVQRPYNPDAKRIAEMMQSDLAKVGVNAKLVTYEWGEYRKRIQNGEATAPLFGWTGDNGDPDNFFFFLGCPNGKPAASNVGKWCDATFEADLVKGTPGDGRDRPRQDLRRHAADPTRPGAGDEHRPFHRVRARQHQGRRLQDEPARPRPVRRGGFEVGLARPSTRRACASATLLCLSHPGQAPDRAGAGRAFPRQAGRVTPGHRTRDEALAREGRA